MLYIGIVIQNLDTKNRNKCFSMFQKNQQKILISWKSLKIHTGYLPCFLMIAHF